MIAYKRAASQCRLVVRRSKKSSWESYLSSINRHTPLRAVWNKIRKISRKNTSHPSPVVQQNGVTIYDPFQVANILAQHFSIISDSGHYSDDFRRLKAGAERHVLNFTSAGTEEYNTSFSQWELTSALRKSRDSAPGPDGICYAMLRHLPLQGFHILLTLFNRIWLEGTFPAAWRRAIVLPFQKPGKDSLQPANYRPIALTSCLCKLMERMVNVRVMWYLEKHHLLSKYQCGFRAGRCTADHLVRLEHEIRVAHVRNQHLVAVFFDLEKAYDTTWKYGILQYLHSLGVRGNLPIFLQNFLQDRSFRVRVGSTYSDHFLQENGVPQGSVLSPVLFILAMNEACSQIPCTVKYSIYVDDLGIYCRANYMPTLQRQLQLAINSMLRWSSSNGFRFSPTKTVAVHFCRRRGLHPDPDLHLQGNVIPVVDSVKFLGLTFDRRLTWMPHVKLLRQRCMKALNILRTLSGTSWGADRFMLMKLYRSLVRSKLDYGCFVYASAAPSTLKILDVVHNAGVRIALGAFRTSPVCSMYVEANEPPLWFRRTKLAIQYAAGVKAMPDHPAREVLFRPESVRLFRAKPSVRLPLGHWLSEVLERVDFNIPVFHPVSVAAIPPWVIPVPPCFLDILPSKKQVCLQDEARSALSEFLSGYPGWTRIYTDGSKSDDGVGCSYLYNRRTYSSRLPDDFSIFSAELVAIDMALLHVLIRGRGNVIVLSDSMSSLQAIGSFNPSYWLLQHIQEKLYHLGRRGRRVQFCWIPSHMGIPGNELVDRAAKAAITTEPILSIPTVPAHIQSIVHQKLHRLWQEQWNTCVPNKLQEIKPLLGSWGSSYRDNRREEIVIARLRIGHSLLTHVHLLRREDAPTCVCGASLSIRHVLVECPRYSIIRRRLGIPQKLSEILADDRLALDKVLSFVKAVHLFKLI